MQYARNFAITELAKDLTIAVVRNERSLIRDILAEIEDVATRENYL